MFNIFVISYFVFTNTVSVCCYFRMTRRHVYKCFCFMFTICISPVSEYSKRIYTTFQLVVFMVQCCQVSLRHSHGHNFYMENASVRMQMTTAIFVCLRGSVGTPSLKALIGSAHTNVRHIGGCAVRWGGGVGRGVVAVVVRVD